MSEPIYIRIKPEDNVAIAVRKIAAGTEIMPGIVTREEIPQAHKIALQDIPKGGAIVRYGVILGYALLDIPCGGWINEHMLELPAPPDVDHMEYGTNIRTDLPKPQRTTWMGYRNAEGYAGTRNYLGIVTTVQCVEGVVNVAVERIRKDLLPKYPHVDDVVAINHAYGCGVAINAPEAKVPIRALTNICKHPNFGGELMVVSLGCEKLQPEMITDRTDADHLIVLQNYKGFENMIRAILDMADKKLAKLNERRREELLYRCEE